MKILHISTYDHGGAGTAALRLHRALKQAGYQSSMIVCSKKSDDADVMEVGSISWANRRWSEIVSSHPSRRRDLELFSMIESESNALLSAYVETADVINLHWISGFIDQRRLRELFAGKRLIWTLHDQNAFTGGCHYSWECRRYQERCYSCPQLGATSGQDLADEQFKLKADVLRDLDLTVVCPSHWLAGEARSSRLLGTKPVEVVAYSQPLDKFRPIPRAFSRGHLGISEDRKVILFGAEMLTNCRKGLAYLVGAMNFMSMKNESPPLFCFFGGVPSGLTIPGETMSLGHVADADVLSAIYSMADVFVLPSLQDNQPNVVAESLAAGTPVVAFNTTGVPEMIVHGSTGYIAESFDMRDLARGIEWVLEHVDNQMRARCREFAESNYGPVAQAAKYVGLYERKMGAKSEQMHGEQTVLQVI